MHRGCRDKAVIKENDRASSSRSTCVALPLNDLMISQRCSWRIRITLTERSPDTFDTLYLKIEEFFERALFCSIFINLIEADLT